MRIIARY